MNDRSSLTWLVWVACGLAALLGISAAPAAPAPLEARTAASASVSAQPAPELRFAVRSAVIYPSTSEVLRFNHERHVTELRLPCTACHDAARRSRRAEDRLRPPPARCDGCHGSDHSDLSHVKGDESEPSSRCQVCHLGYQPEHGNAVARFVNKPAHLKFNHAVHVAAKLGCEGCHAGVEHSATAGREHLPSMQQCVTCHRLNAGGPRHPSGECAVCHVTAGRRLQTHFAEGRLLPPAWLGHAEHDPAFAMRHAVLAANDSGLCAKCHVEKDCADCHDGRVRPRRLHPNDFLSMHAVAARHDRPRCASCHQQQTFCLSCHQRLGVSSSSPTALAAERGRFHPPSQIFVEGPRSARHHAVEAQRNLNVCVACHTERDCVSCHATREIGAGGLSADGARLNPHPPGFSARCARLLSQNPRPCLVCHELSDARLQECR
ncbi:MAG TPA: cytochrome c3 family protein [Polyangiaceae bacterium]|nr:cytochrome c3 family protein [Polyangiaceae bacterium]